MILALSGCDKLNTLSIPPAARPVAAPQVTQDSPHPVAHWVPATDGASDRSGTDSASVRQANYNSGDEASSNAAPLATIPPATVVVPGY
ncbi:MAG TPA: hypothetical protein VFE24_01195, partial [Pirellulales bacterium]|nr:hypothetical protein [Pirellulales bacterium]